MSIEIPLFPLNLVLFPGMQLPLHIFESRYRLMIRRCLQADHTFGVALIMEGEEGQPDTIPAGAGCTAEILESTPFADGRMNLLTVGRRRFRVLCTREQDGYLMGSVEWIDDEAGGADTTRQANRVQRLVRRYLSSLTQNVRVSSVSLDDIDIPDDPYGLSMWVAALVPLTVDQKQELLELDSTHERLTLEHELLHRAEIVQQAYARRQHGTTADEPFGPYSEFASLN